MKLCLFNDEDGDTIAIESTDVSVFSVGMTNSEPAKRATRVTMRTGDAYYIEQDILDVIAELDSVNPVSAPIPHSSSSAAEYGYQAAYLDLAVIGELAALSGQEAFNPAVNQWLVEVVVKIQTYITNLNGVRHG